MAKFIAVVCLFAIGIIMNGNLAKAEEAEITAVQIKTGKENLEEHKYSGTTEYDESTYKSTSVIKVITKSSGILRFHYQGENEDRVSFYLYDNEDMEKYMTITSLTASDDEVVSSGIAIPKAGTYYLEIRNYEKEGFDFTIAADIHSADDQTLKSGKTTLLSFVDYKDENYYKFTISKPGRVRIYTANVDGNEAYLSVEVYQKVNGKMKLVVPSDSKASGSAVGLKKGTYYIKLSRGTSTRFYSLKYTFTAINDTSGSTRSKAAKLTLGKSKTGVILANEKKGKADWYKVTIPKTKKVTINIKGELSGSATVTLYNAKGEKFIGGIYLSKYRTEDKASPTNNNKKTLNKGTYYIKVTKDDSNTSGSYSISVK